MLQGTKKYKSITKIRTQCSKLCYVMPCHWSTWPHSWKLISTQNEYVDSAISQKKRVINAKTALFDCQSVAGILSRRIEAILSYNHRKYLIDINHLHAKSRNMYIPNWVGDTDAQTLSTYIYSWHPKLWQGAACRKYYRGFVVICKIRAIIADDISRVVISSECDRKN